MQILCKHCGRRFTVRHVYDRDVVRCPNCKQNVADKDLYFGRWIRGVSGGVLGGLYVQISPKFRPELYDWMGLPGWGVYVVYFTQLLVLVALLDVLIVWCIRLVIQLCHKWKTK